MGVGIDQQRIDKDFPLLIEMAHEHDFAERMGRTETPLHAEAAAALREIHGGRTNVPALRAALLSMRRLANVSTEGDSWYAQASGLDAGAIFAEARDALGETERG